MQEEPTGSGQNRGQDENPIYMEMEYTGEERSREPLHAWGGASSLQGPQEEDPG